MSTLVVQERHLWLNMADMREPDKVWFLNSPVCQAGLFGDAVENFAQQFSMAQKQKEAIKHILPRRPAAASTQSLAAVPPSARRRGRPPAATSTPAQPKQQPPPRRQVAGRNGNAQPPSNPATNVRVSGPEMGDPEVGGSALREMVSASPGGGPGGESFVSFCFCSAAGSSESSGTHIFNKRAISYISWSQEGAVGGVRRVANTLPTPSPSLFASSQWCVVRGHHQAFSHSRCPSLGPGKFCAAHADSTSGRLSASRVESLCSTLLPHHVCGSVGPACTVSGSLASAPQPVSLAHPHHQTRLCNSVRPASPQVQGHPLHLCAKQRCPCLTERDRSPPTLLCPRKVVGCDQSWTCEP